MTKMTSMPRLVAVGMLAAIFAPHVAAGFIQDSTLAITTRNFYLDRDYKGETPYSAAREWAQGFILRAHSGYTEGPVGLGLDATAMVGLKLDSSPDRTGTQLLAYNPITREARDEYSELGLTAKARVSNTRLSIGTQFPSLPIIYASPARLLPQSFRGAYLVSEELEGLTVHLGRMDKVNLRDSTDYQPIGLATPNRRFKAGAASERFDFVGADYRWNPSLTSRLFHAELQDIYTQDYVGLLHLLPIGSGKLKSDIRVFNSRDDGSAKGGRVDNLNVGGMFSYLWGGHSLGVGYMRQFGDTAFPYIAGQEPVVLSDGTMSADFVNPKERTWALRYDYDFAAMGLPGLTGMVRYLHGDSIDLPLLGGTQRSESTKDFELAYVIQSGALKGLGLRLREAFYRNNLTSAATFRSDNETRINIDYTYKFW